MQRIPELKSNRSMQADQQCSIRITLENSDLWKSFHNIGTEMIITKHGRRMFPHCCISITGMQHFVNYVIMVDMVPVDSYKYKWKKELWEIAGKAEPQPLYRTYMHPDSPAPGSHWMKQSLSFLKMKLTNNTLDQHGHIILHSMHRYYPRFHVTQADSPYTVCWGPFQTFTFPETTFIAVTAYQNPKITKLKIDHNPFAKGFREGGTHSHSKRCRPNRSPSAKKAAANKKALGKSPPGLQRMPSTSQSVQTEKIQVSTPRVKEGDLSIWPQDVGTSPHAEHLEQQEYDYSCEEQMVPASMAYQPYRPPDYNRFPLPANQMDVAHTAVQLPPLPPRRRRPPPPPLPPPPGSLHAAGQATANPQQPGYYNPPQARNPGGDWSQYPLFPYSCW